MVTQQLALGVGANGALIDVSSFVAGPEGVAYSYGRQSEFRDPNPGQFTFVLENQDGRFTPGNTSSPLATLLTEGAAACWNFNGRLVAGVVSAIVPGATEDQWGRITLTIGDVFYIANRTILPASLATGIAEHSAVWFWPMSDAVGSTSAAEFNGIGLPLVPSAGTNYAFGVAGPNGDTQLQVTTTGAAQGVFTGGVNPKNPPGVSAPIAVPPWLGFWYTPDASGHSQFQLDVQLPSSHEFPLITCTAGTVTLALGTGGGSVSSTFKVPTPGQPYYVAVSFSLSGKTASLYINGALIGTVSGSSGNLSAGSTLGLTLTFGDGVAASVQTVSHLTFSNGQLYEGGASLPCSLPSRFQALASAVPAITVGTIDSAVSPAVLDIQSTAQANVWSLLCDVLRTEQGHLYTSTSGSLLSPSTVVNLRARSRPTTAAASATFDASLELQDVPGFVRDITNMYSAMTAAGPTSSVTVFDRSIESRAGSATGSETVALQSLTDLRMWAQDRLVRGKNVALQVVSITIDAMTTPTNRYADLIGLTPGDRVKITNIASAALGFSTWEGWFLGASEVHNFQSDAFTLYLAPVLPPSGIFDTDLFAAGTSLALSSALGATAGATLRTNHCISPIPTNTTGWQGPGTTGLATMSDGTPCFQATTTTVVTPYAWSAKADIAASSGDVWVLSGIIEVVGDVPGAVYNVRAHGVTGNVYFASGLQTYTAGSGPQRVTVIATLNANVAAGELGLSAVRAAGGASGVSVRMSQVLIEKASSFAGYFDGNTAATSSYLYSWTGTAGASTSVQQAATWATSMTVASGDGTALETVQVPYTLQIDQEQVTVTAAGALGATQTATVTRGVNGTTPAIHAAGAYVELANPPLFAF